MPTLDHATFIRLRVPSPGVSSASRRGTVSRREVSAPRPALCTAVLAARRRLDSRDGPPGIDELAFAVAAQDFG